MSLIFIFIVVSIVRLSTDSNFLVKDRHTRHAFHITRLVRFSGEVVRFTMGINVNYATSYRFGINTGFC